MNGFLTKPVVLSGRQSVEFINSLRNPGKEYLNKRNEIFDRMDAGISIERKGRDLEVEIPNLDLSFIDEESEASSGIELSIEVSVVLDAGCMDCSHFHKIDESCLKVINSNSFFDFEDGGKRESFIYNETGRDMPVVSVKDKRSDCMAEAYKTEQIADAA